MKLGDGRNELAGRFIRVVIHNIAIFENKTAVEVENELAAQVNLSYASMQKYKSGYPITDNRLIKIIVENGVKRGMVTYEWAKKFLDYSYYPETKALLDELFPSKTAVDRPIIANNNLPSPSYSKFVMRQGYFDDIGTKLSCRSSVLLIISLGGMGKTSIVREIASECISPVVRYQTVPRFHAAVWISDREKPGQTNITTVLDEIASTLGYDGVAKLAFDEKNSEVMRLLKTTKTLLILDNFDTVRDDSLIEWLINLPEPSKCIVATREYHRLFRNNTTVIELKGMNEFEARDFIDNRMRALGLSTSVIADDRFLSVLKATGGNPKAMEMVVGQIRHGSSLDTILEDLSNAKGDIFTDLFSRAWNLLNEDEKQTLMLMSMFPGGTVRSALPELLCLNSTQLESAVTKLSELSLISIENEAPLDDPFYSLHPLVQLFCSTNTKCGQLC